METINFASATVAEIVAEDYRTAEIFKKYGIDFCCGGKKTIDTVCAEKKISFDDLLGDLEKMGQSQDPAAQNYKDWKPGFLVDYIVNVHHDYVKKNIPLITEFAEKVSRVHGPHEPSLTEILKIWNQVAGELTAHMQKEELMLFPYIKKMERMQSGEAEFTPAVFGTVKNPVRMMEAEHDIAGMLMRQIAKLSNNFAAPDHACNTYRVLFAKLQEFENDLHTHVHLENNILFPKAEQMESDLNNPPSGCSCSLPN